MKTVALSHWTLAFFSLASCARPTREVPATPPGFDAAAIESEVTQTVRDCFAGFGKATCTDGSAVSKFASDSSVYVDDTELYVVSLAEYEMGVRERACKWRSHGGGVDSIRVHAMSPDAAMAAWTYHDDILLKTDKRRQTRGAVLMTLVKRDSVWRITSSKTTEVVSP
ncbi:MAG: hypothetical protein IPN16_21585 [Gemmatimonadetes bacterium]|nr:hypothetical protein [Gemmatimonadota bacterium]